MTEEDDCTSTRRDVKIILDDPHISSTHCHIWSIQFDETTPCMVYLQDVSTNGCYLNGVKLGRNNYTVVEEGDMIHIPRGLKVHLHCKKRVLDLIESSRTVIEDSTYDFFDNDWDIVSKIVGVGTFGKVTE